MVYKAQGASASFSGLQTSSFKLPHQRALWTASGGSKNFIGCCILVRPVIYTPLSKLIQKLNGLKIDTSAL